MKNEVVLKVNEKYSSTQNLYEKVGFQDKGLRRMGPIGQQIIMHLPIIKEEEKLTLASKSSKFLFGTIYVVKYINKRNRK